MFIRYGPAWKEDLSRSLFYGRECKGAEHDRTEIWFTIVQTNLLVYWPFQSGLLSMRPDNQKKKNYPRVAVARGL